MIIKNQHRLGLSAYYFLSGFGFSTWTSRIPSIKDQLQLNEAELGSILMAMPISSLIGLPLSAYLVARFSTRKPMLLGFVIYAISLFAIGYADSITFLVAAIVGVAFFMRIVNVSMNTQAINVQRLFTKKINGSFHAMWSLGGIAGVGFTTLMILLGVGIKAHFLWFLVIALPTGIAAYQMLLTNDRSTTGNKLILNKPDPYIMSLGFMILFAAICEGGMFDWSGIYFKEVVQSEVYTYGFLLFMVCMTLSRFASDWVIQVLGIQTTFLVCAVVVASGFSLAIIFPFFWPAMIGFALVGMGAAPVIPMAVQQAGESQRYSPGIAVAIISTYSTTGMLVGPPLIGYVAHLLNLRFSFVLLLLAGLAIVPLSKRFFKIKEGKIQ